MFHDLACSDEDLLTTATSKNSCSPPFNAQLRYRFNAFWSFFVAGRDFLYCRAVDGKMPLTKLCQLYNEVVGFLGLVSYRFSWVMGSTNAIATRGTLLALSWYNGRCPPCYVDGVILRRLEPLTMPKWK